MSCINISIPKITGIFPHFFLICLFACLFILRMQCLQIKMASYVVSLQSQISFSSVCLSSVFHLTFNLIA